MRVKKGSGSGGHWSRVLVWWSWELGGHMVAVDRGGSGGGGLGLPMGFVHLSRGWRGCMAGDWVCWRWQWWHSCP